MKSITLNLDKSVPYHLTTYIFFGIPELSSYLEKKYGEDYQEWSKATKKLIPFIY